MSDDCPEIRRLYLDTFAAEAKPAEGIGGVPWRAFLERVLDDDFLLRRSDVRRPDEGRREMLDAIEQGVVRQRRPVEEETRAWCADALGVVEGPVDVEIDGVWRRFRNVKVFTRNPGGSWRCVHWQVTETPPPAQG